MALTPEYINFSEFCASKKEFEDLITSLNLNPVAHGNEWDVYKIEYPKGSGQFLAYKKLRDTAKADQVFYRNIFRELDITNRARHPCTIELISYDLSEIDKPIVINPFYQNGSLDKFIGDYDGRGNYRFNSKYAKFAGVKVSSEDPHSKDSKIEFVNGTFCTILLYGIARGIRYLHKLKIFHRDLKPANIVIDENGRPHIADFGYSKINGDANEQSKQVGTPLFMAPEIFDGVNFSFPADIYALGLIFYILTEFELYLPKFKGNVNVKMRFTAYQNKLKSGIGLNLKMRESNQLSDLIKSMVLWNPEQRPKIDEVCKKLKNKKYWFPKTVEKEFNDYKKEIDNFEDAQFHLINDKIITNESNKLTKQMKPDKSAKSKYKDIQTLFKSCSESNDEAECALGSIFYTGYYGIPKDYVMAWRYFKEAKKHGSVQANSFMNNILNEIVDIEKKNYNEDFQKLTNYIQDESDPIFSKIHHKRSQLLYGMIKESENEYKEALNLYIKSSQQGCNEAKSRLGSLLLKTNNQLELSEKLLEETSQWKRSQKQCDIPYYIDDNERKLSLLNLGLLKKQKGQLDESIKIFEELMNEDHPDAALLIGSCYDSLGNKEEAINYYKKSYDEFDNASAKVLLDYHKPPKKKKSK